MNTTYAHSNQTPAAQDVRDRLLARLPAIERRLSLNGIATAVLDGGADGTPVVLLHGPGACGAQWARSIRALVPTHRVIAPDLPGHGATAMFDGVPDPARVSGWLEDLIDCTCAVPPVLVGHTLGGAVAAHFASTHGDSVAALVLVDALGLVEFSPTQAFGSALHAFLSAPTALSHDRLWSQCLFDAAAVAKRFGEEWALIKAYSLACAQQPERLAALGALMAQFGLPAISPATLKAIKPPTTLIWGRHDRATALAAAEECARRYRWNLLVIDGAADDPTLDQPELYLAALRRVLESAAIRRAS